LLNNLIDKKYIFNTVNSVQTLSSGQGKVAQKSGMIKNVSTLKNFRPNSVFRPSASCSKILNDKKYIFNAVKNFKATVFRASASCSKILNDKKYFNTVKNFRASASCSKILNDKKMQYIQYS